jgi:hypothetical protein
MFLLLSLSSIATEVSIYSLNDLTDSDSENYNSAVEYFEDNSSSSNYYHLGKAYKDYNESQSEYFPYDYEEISRLINEVPAYQKNEKLSPEDRRYLEYKLQFLLESWEGKSDKQLHTEAGRLTSFIASEFCGSNIVKTRYSKGRQKFACGVGAATIIGILKEVVDSAGYGNVEGADALATSFGGVLFKIDF